MGGWVAAAGHGCSQEQLQATAGWLGWVALMEPPPPGYSCRLLLGVLATRAVAVISVTGFTERSSIF